MHTMQYQFKLRQLLAIFGLVAACSTNIGLSITRPARADDQLFPDPPAAMAPLSSPLSGSVRVIDQVRKGPMRLKRANVDGASSTPFSAETAFPSTSSSNSDSGSSGSSINSSPNHSGSVSSSGSDSGLQALFPSTDSFNPPPALNGAVSADAKAKKKHVYIWNMSLAGGYYDVTNTFQGVVPGNKLYLYGGFMADGHTPVPTGPVPMNEGGHIRWTPIMGSPPDDD